MNKNAKKWIKALRSGEFKQTKGTLNDENGYCCLGVACSVYEKETGKTLPRDDKGYYNGGALPFLRGKFDIVKEWLGLKDDVGWLENDVRRSLVDINDLENTNFNSIADIIEKNQEKLFIKEEK